MKKGFTLIELLAVIVILAIIALIATPIVLNIINNSKESANLRSAEMYLKAVETSIATSTLNNQKVKNGTYEIDSGNICLEYSDNKCINELKVEVKGETPSSGSITIASGKVTDIDLKYSNDKIIVKDTSGNLVYAKTLDDICTYQNNGVAEKTAGAIYTCEVKKGTSYNFYVLKTPSEGDTTINLIMDRNICEDGTLTDASKEDKCIVVWNNESEQSTNSYGPVTAMDYLYNATKDWLNIPNIKMNYADEGNTGDYGYGTIVTTDNITKIIKKDGTAVTVLTDQEGYSNLKARLPYKSEVNSYDSTNKTNSYLYDYLNSYNSIQTNAISGIYGYWTVSSYAESSSRAWRVYFNGNINNCDTYFGNYNGIRPVINLKI